MAQSRPLFYLMMCTDVDDDAERCRKAIGYVNKDRFCRINMPVQSQNWGPNHPLVDLTTYFHRHPRRLNSAHHTFPIGCSRIIGSVDGC